MSAEHRTEDFQCNSTAAGRDKELLVIRCMCLKQQVLTIGLVTGKNVPSAKAVHAPFLRFQYGFLAQVAASLTARSLRFGREFGYFRTTIARPHEVRFYRRAKYVASMALGRRVS